MKKNSSTKFILPKTITSKTFAKLNTPDFLNNSNDSKLKLEENIQTNKLCFENFNILKLIGRGGYGRVFMVSCNLNQKIYAMKALKKVSLSNKTVSSVP